MFLMDQQNTNYTYTSNLDPVQPLSELPEHLVNKKILIVEDEEDAAIIFQTLISTDGYKTVDYALNGKEALEKQKEKKYDLILLDIIMPVMDGIETLQHLRKESDVYGNPKVVVLTNLTGEMAEDSVNQYRIDGFVVKIDSDPEQLLRKIREVLDR